MVEVVSGAFIGHSRLPFLENVVNCSNEPLAFDIWFHRQASDVAFLMPSSPCTIVGLRPSHRHHLEQWWELAKRTIYHTWPYLIDCRTGVFLVTKCVKTKRYASCISRGARGQMSQIQVRGMAAAPTQDNIDLPARGTQWVVLRNDLGFQVREAAGDLQYTIFIERDASRLFNLAEPNLRAAAQVLWGYLQALSFLGLVDT